VGNPESLTQTWSKDTCGDLSAASWSGLGSTLIIERESQKAKRTILVASVSPGSLHLAGFHFRDVGFVGDGPECLSEANEHIYLLDVEAKRLGTLVKGERFIQLTPRFEKKL